MLGRFAGEHRFEGLGQVVSRRCSALLTQGWEAVIDSPMIDQPVPAREDRRFRSDSHPTKLHQPMLRVAQGAARILIFFGVLQNVSQ